MGGPSLGDGFVRCKAVEGLETLGEVVGIQEGSEVFLELLVCGVVISAYGGFLKGSVHAFDLAVIRYVIFGAFRPAVLLRNGLMVSPSGTWGTGSTKVRAGRPKTVG